MNEEKKETLTTGAETPETPQEKKQAPQKSINTAPLSADSSAKLVTLLNELEAFKKVCDEKLATLSEQDANITRLMKKLSDLQIIKVHEQRLERKDPGLELFFMVAEPMSKRIELIVAECKPWSSASTMPATILVNEKDTDSFAEYVEQTMEVLKRFLKRQKKDFDVMNSRTVFSLNNQELQLKHIENLLIQHKLKTPTEK